MPMFSRLNRVYVVVTGVVMWAGLSFVVGCGEYGASRPSRTMGLTPEEISKLPPDPAVLARREGPQHPVIYSSTGSLPRVETGELDALGRPVTVSCASCHSNMTPNRQVYSAEQLTEFHLGMTFDHGSVLQPLSCVTCHHEDNYNHLRLADGRALEFHQSKTMCAQCHSKQATDFEHGAHGGMSGYWDLSRGPQYRKTCIDCHDPHAPKFPSMQPLFKPYDRFLSGEQH